MSQENNQEQLLVSGENLVMMYKLDEEFRIKIPDSIIKELGLIRGKYCVQFFIDPLKPHQAMLYLSNFITSRKLANNGTIYLENYIRQVLGVSEGDWIGFEVAKALPHGKVLVFKKVIQELKEKGS